MISSGGTGVSGAAGLPEARSLQVPVAANSGFLKFHSPQIPEHGFHMLREQVDKSLRIVLGVPQRVLSQEPHTSLLELGRINHPVAATLVKENADQFGDAYNVLRFHLVTQTAMTTTEKQQ